MHNVWLIAKREYLERITTKSFLLMTILIPVLMIGGGAGSALLAARAHSSAHIAIVSPDQQLALDLQAELEHGKDSEMTADVISPPTSSTRNTLDQKLAGKALDGYLWITPAASANVRPSFTYTSRSAADIATKGTITSSLRTILIRERLAHQGMVAADVDALLENVHVETTLAGKAADTTTAFFAAYALFFLMYFVIMLYGMNVARSIIEEKTSRVFEVLLATIRPEEMMAGKVLGVGSVGLTQIFIWLSTALLLTSTQLLASIGSGVHIHLSFAQIGFFFLFFLLGYLLYSSIAAALGAMTNSEQELQQLNLFLAMPLAGCMFALGVVIANPDGVASQVISLIPFCTPLIMYLRISMGNPPVWQIALSILLMLATTCFTLWLASRIYRVGILMYGKKPNLPEIVRWLKYS